MPQLLQGTLSPTLVAELGSHLAGCEVCQTELAEEQALSRRLRDVVRYPSPAHLRVQIAQQLEGRTWTRIPRSVTWRWLAASAVVLLAVAASALVLTRRDVLHAFIPEATRNYREMVMQHELFGFPDVGPWGSTELPRLLSEQLGLPVTSLFLGDSELVLMAARPLLVRDRKGMVLLYADRRGWVSSLLLVAATDIEIPRGSRLQLGAFRPYHTQADSLRVVVWKQGEMACFLVAQAGDQQLADLLLKIRSAM
jgi:anti-sigma factor RsiW